MHVFAGEIPSLPRGSNRENAKRVGGGEHRGKEQAESSTTRAHRRSFPLSRSLYLPHPTYESRSRLVSPYIPNSLTLGDSLRSYFPYPIPLRTSHLRSGRRKKCVCVWTLAR